MHHSKSTPVARPCSSSALCHAIARPGADRSARIWLHDMALERASGSPIDIGAIEGPVEATLLALFRGLAESDAFNVLVLEAGLGWRDVAMVRALGRYLRQIGVAFTQGYLAAALARHGIMCAGGHFYAYRLMEALGINPGHGVLRLSFTHYTSTEDVQRLITALDAEI